MLKTHQFRNPALFTKSFNQDQKVFITIPILSCENKAIVPKVQ